MSRGNIITLYSYKGGVGRTFALANIASLLSLWGYKVLCVDWDLEAPGLHLYFKPWLKKTVSPGLVELIEAYADGNAPDWHDFVTEVAVPGAPRPLLLMQAGALTSSYVQRMQALDWNMLYENQHLGNFVETLRETWKDDFDFVFVDSRTGVTDTASICTVQLPDILMLLLTANHQSLDGSLDTLRRIHMKRAGFPLDRAKLLVVPIVSRFERRVEYALADRWLKRFAEIFPAIYGDWVQKDVDARELLNFLRIPHVPIWNFGEEVPAITRATSDTDDVGYSLETLAALVAQNLSATDMLVENRDHYVVAAKTRVPQQLAQAEQLKAGARVFISYAPHDREYMQELLMHLKILERQQVVDVWSDQLISLGESRDEIVGQMLQEANVILLLISSDYLALDDLYEREMQPALKRYEAGQAVVIPVLLRSVDWHNTSLAPLEMLPPGAVPVAAWRNRDEAWVDVTRNIRRVINTLRDKKA